MFTGMRDISARNGQGWSVANKVRDDLTAAIEEKRAALEQAALDAELQAKRSMSPCLVAR